MFCFVATSESLDPENICPEPVEEPMSPTKDLVSLKCLNENLAETKLEEVTLFSNTIFQDIILLALYRSPKVTHKMIKRWRKQSKMKLLNLILKKIITNR